VQPRTDIPAAIANERYWDRVIGRWNDQQKDTVWRAHSDAVNAALLTKWLPSQPLRHILKTDLFDEAVSEGLYPLLQSRAERVTGIDLSPQVVNAARGRFPLLRGVSTDVRHLPFADGEFDAVVSLSTLDHFESVEEIRVALGELHRVLSQGGTLIITLDNGLNPAVALRNWLPYECLRFMGLVAYRVGATCRPSHFASLLRSRCFDLREVAFTIHAPRLIAIIVSRLVERFGSLATRRRFLRVLAAGERLDWWPTRKLTGYFIAALCTKS
jgi:SAM-dependent methyltransferase